MTTSRKQPKPAGRLRRFVLKFQCLGHHQWKRVSTQINGIGFLDECEKCGRGRFLVWAGHASATGTLSAEEMQEWHREANYQNDQGDGRRENA